MRKLWDLKPIEPVTEIVMPGDTIVDVFWNAVERRADSIWLQQKDFGIWQSWTWTEVGVAVREIANGLIALGFQARETGSILSNTKVEWVMADLALLSAGGVSNGIYPTDAPTQVEYICTDSGTTVLFVEDDEQLDKALQVRAQLPKLRKIIVEDMEGLRDLADDQVISLEALRELGRQYAAEHPDALQQRMDAIDPESLAILIYTSGTTGKPKGGMHSHKGIVWGCHNMNLVYPQFETDKRMCFLPLCHIAERFWGEYVGLYTGTTLCFVEKPETVPENLREIAPNIGTAVPRIWEKFYSSVEIAVKDATWLQRKLYAWSIDVGGRIADLVLERKPVSLALKIKFMIARFVALDNICRFIGIHRARYLHTGAAPISPNLIRWYLSLGVPMLEVWGMTETIAAQTAMPREAIKVGSVGKACQYNELKIDPKTGEILVRGDVLFMGYLNLPEKTAEVIDADGWLHTGDVGEVDDEGYYKIVDRLKDIIITAGGKNISPSEIENELKFSPYIIDAVVIGDGRRYPVAIIMIDLENVEKYAQDNSIPFGNYESLTASPEINALIQQEVDKVNAKLARVEQVKKFWLLNIQLDAEDEELTPTMKLKRKLVEKKYAAEIDRMYS